MVGLPPREGASLDLDGPAFILNPASFLLAANAQVVQGQDVMISVYNIHHSPAVWDQPEEFIPERFGPLDGPVPNEQV